MISSYYFAQGVKDVAGFSNEDLQKWKGAGNDPFESEDKIEQMVAPAAFITKELDMYIDVRIKDAAENGTPQELQAWMQRKVERDMAGKDEVINKKFIAGFIAFLLGKTNPLSPEYKVIKETYCSPELWGKPEAQRPGDGWDLQKYPPIARHDAAGDEIRAYISTWTDKHFDTLKKAIALKINGPRTLREHFIFYKLIVMGGLKSYGTKPLPEIFTDGWDYPNGGGAKGPHPFDNDDDNGDERRDGYYRSMNNYGPEPPRDPTNTTDRTALGNAYDPAESFAEILQNRWDRIRDRADRRFQERIANNELFTRRVVFGAPPPPAGLAPPPQQAPPPIPNPAPPPPQPQQPQQPAPPIPLQAPPPPPPPQPAQPDPNAPVQQAPPPPALPALAGAPAAAIVQQPGLIQELPENYLDIAHSKDDIYNTEIVKYAPHVAERIRHHRILYVQQAGLKKIYDTIVEDKTKFAEHLTNVNNILVAINKDLQNPANPVSEVYERRLVKTEQTMEKQTEIIQALKTAIEGNEKSRKEALDILTRLDSKNSSLSEQNVQTITEIVQKELAVVLEGHNKIITEIITDARGNHSKAIETLQTQINKLDVVIGKLPVNDFTSTISAAIRSQLKDLGNKTNQLHQTVLDQDAEQKKLTIAQHLIYNDMLTTVNTASSRVEEIIGDNEEIKEIHNALMKQYEEIKQRHEQVYKMLIEYRQTEEDPMDWDGLPLLRPESPVISQLTTLSHSDTCNIFIRLNNGDGVVAYSRAQYYFGSRFNIHDPWSEIDWQHFYHRLAMETTTASPAEIATISSLYLHSWYNSMPPDQKPFQDIQEGYQILHDDLIKHRQTAQTSNFQITTQQFDPAAIQQLTALALTAPGRSDPDFLDFMEDQEDEDEEYVEEEGEDGDYVTRYIEGDGTLAADFRSLLMSQLSPDIKKGELETRIRDIHKSTTDQEYKDYLADVILFQTDNDLWSTAMSKKLEEQGHNVTPAQTRMYMTPYLTFPTPTQIQEYHNNNRRLVPSQPRQLTRKK